MALLTFRETVVSFGGPPLFDGISFQIERGERLCLVGRNGVGKSTLLKLVTGDLLPEDGEIVRQQGLRVAQLAQEVPKDAQGTVFDVVSSGLGDVGALLQRYHHIVHDLAESGDEKLLTELEHCQHELESAGGWEMNQRVETAISRLELDADADMGSLSGGWKRRVLLARALANEPDLLLLDEPTNHLDIEAITWLEDFLLGWGGTLLFITHDRVFLQKLATRIIELDRGKLSDWPGDYAMYLRRKQETLDAEEKQDALFDKKLAQEEVWIRQGIKARRTRNEGRVRALKQMREERAGRRSRISKVKMQIQEAQRSGKVVVETEHVDFGYDGKPVVHDLSTTILRGDKVGIIGPNGAGKTTLLRILLGELEPQQGRVKLGANLEIVYFDQYRAVLDEEKTVQDSVSGGSDMLSINGGQRHVLSYLQDFLFTPQRARQPVKALSGGERNRLLLARLFTKPSNVMVLDEPTNDLDAETLDLLEELVMDYQGTVLLVSHDRAFLNNVVTNTLVFEGDAVVNEYVGGYDDWLRQRATTSIQQTARKPQAEIPKSVNNKSSKLSYKDQRELDSLPARIEQLEQEQVALHDKMAHPDFYKQDQDKIANTRARLERKQEELASAYERWEALEGMRT